MIKTLNSLDKGGNVVDLTGATADYQLAVGETAYIQCVNSSTVPLRIATTAGEYSMSIQGMPHTTDDVGVNLLLLPNNTEQPDGDINYNRFSQIGTTMDGTSDSTSYRGFVITNSPNSLGQRGFIYTHTNAKMVTTAFYLRSGADTYRQFLAFQPWMNDSVTWSSLGTLTSTKAFSATVRVTRIL